MRKLISREAADFGSSSVAVVNYEKPFIFTGFGIQNGDRIKFIRHRSANDLSCRDRSENITIGGGTNLEDVVRQSKASLTFLLQSVAYQPHFLCYAFEEEPFKLYTNFAIHAKTIDSIESTKAIIGSPRDVIFFSAHVTGRDASGDIGLIDGPQDRAKWVQQGDPCDSAPAAGSQEQIVTRSVNLPSGEATFTYDQDEGILNLCYAFGFEPFQLFPNINMNTIVPDITNISSDVSVQGAAKTFIFPGTFGITKNDTAKWIKPSSSCLDYGSGGQSDVLSYPVGGFPKAESRFVTFKFSDAPPFDEPWVLCWRFGRGSYTKFTNIKMRVKRIDNVTIVTDSDPTVGGVVTMLFSGIGIFDGDVAKMIYAGSSCDGEAAAGSAAGTVREKKSTFVFNHLQSI